MKRKLIVIWLGGALVLAVIVLLAKRNTDAESRAASKPHVAVQDGKLVLIPTNKNWNVTFVYSDKRKLSNTTSQPTRQ